MRAGLPARSNPRQGLRFLAAGERPANVQERETTLARIPRLDRKSTRLNSSHSQISYAVFCLKKKTIAELLLADGSRAATRRKKPGDYAHARGLGSSLRCKRAMMDQHHTTAALAQTTVHSLAF